MIKGLITDFKAQIVKNKDFAYITLLFLLCSIFYLLFPAQYKLLLRIYMLALMHGASFLLSVFRIKHFFDSSTLSFVFDSYMYVPDIQFAALKFTFVAVLLPLVFLKLSLRGRPLYVFLILIFIYCLNSTRIFFVLQYVNAHHQIPGQSHDLLFHAILLALPLGSYIWLTKWEWNHFFAGKSGEEASVLQKIIALFLVFSFVRYMYYLFVVKLVNSEWILNSLTFVVFSISKFILSQFLIYVTFTDRVLSDVNNTIYMGNPCVGLNIMLVFAIVVFVYKGKILQKVMFTLVGLIFIIFLNAIRVSLLFAYLDEAGSSDLVISEWHAVYNSVIYISVFLLWVGWFNLQRQLSKKVTQSEITNPNSEITIR